MTSEAAVLNQILTVWGSHPQVRLWRTNAGSAWAPDGQGGFRPITLAIKGFPDLVGVARCPYMLVGEPEPVLISRWIGVECKRPRTPTQKIGSLSPDQRVFHAWAQSFGMLCFTAWSVEDVDRELEKVGIRR